MMEFFGCDQLSQAGGGPETIVYVDINATEERRNIRVRFSAIKKEVDEIRVAVEDDMDLFLDSWCGELDWMVYDGIHVWVNLTQKLLIWDHKEIS